MPRTSRKLQGRQLRLQQMSIINSELQLHPIQIHKCHQENETVFEIPSKLLPSVQCAYRNPQTNFEANTFIYK